MRSSRATVIGLHTESDHVLSVVAPVGLAAAAARPALVIDLDPNGPAYPGTRSLADLVGEGPTRLSSFLARPVPVAPALHCSEMAGSVGSRPCR